MPTTSAPRSNRNALSSSAAALYEKLDLKPAAKAQLEASATRIFDLGRRTTEQTFELGDQLQQAAALLPDDGFDTWIDMRCGLKPRSARNYMAVFRNLSEFRDDLVDLSIGSTVLFHLSSATPEQIREAIAYADENGRLQVSDVKTMLASGDSDETTQPRVDLFSIGGSAGLKALIAAKTRDGVKSLLGHVAAILEAIRTALEKPRVIKEALSKAVQELARVARQELESLALFIEADLDLGRHARGTKFPDGSEWAQVKETLDMLGGVEAWPKAAAVRNWLVTDVIPVLEWAISKERKPQWPLAKPEAAQAEPKGLIDDAFVGETGEEPVTSEPGDVGKGPTKRKQIADLPPLASDIDPGHVEEEAFAPPMLA